MTQEFTFFIHSHKPRLLLPKDFFFLKIPLNLLCCADLSCLIVQRQCYVSNRKWRVELGPTKNLGRNTVFFLLLFLFGLMPTRGGRSQSPASSQHCLAYCDDDLKMAMTEGEMLKYHLRVKLSAKKGWRRGFLRKSSQMSHTFAHVTRTTHMTADR